MKTTTTTTKATTTQPAGHTPGPWYRMDMCYRDADRVSIEICTFNNDGLPSQRVATVNHCDINPTQEVTESVAANARLIAAAPDLLAALEKVSDALRLLRNEDNYLDPNWDYCAAATEAFDTARAAIARARGLGVES
jgi:hypothetical protein